MRIRGKTIDLIPARISDCEKIYNWLCKSDLTSSMQGPPNYPEHPVPTLEEFRNDYPLSFFNVSGDGTDRVLIIIVDGEEVEKQDTIYSI